MTDWAYTEARDRALRALLERPAVAPPFGVVDWSYADAIRVAQEYADWTREEALRQFHERVVMMARVMTTAMMDLADALAEALRPLVETLATLFDAFRGFESEPDVSPAPPPWRAPARPSVPRTLGAPFVAMSRCPVPRRRPRDRC